MLDAARDYGGRVAGHYPLGRRRDGLQPRGAETVDGLPRHGLRESGSQEGLASNVVALSTLRHSATYNNVLDLRGIEFPSPIERFLYTGGRHIRRVRRPESAFGSASDGGPSTR